MKFRIFFTLLLLLAIAPFALGQKYTTSNGKAIKLFEKGQTALYQSNSDEAIRCFKQALQLDANFVEANIMLAEWYLDANQPALAKQHYYAAVQTNPEFFTQAWLQIGELELKAGNFAKAKESYETFLKLDKKNLDRHEAAQYGIDCAEFRAQAMAHPVDFHPSNLGPAINTADDEYLPALTVDGQTLIFTRRFPRKNSTVATSPEEEDFYTSTYENGQWQPATRMSEPVNSNDNEGAQCISQDGRIMFFTACGRRDGGGRCDIYMCTRRGDKWSTPRNLGPDVNSGSWESQPSFSIDGRTLYFVSDRKGGYGKMDIWKTVYTNGQWSTPENLGPNINTAGDDMSPFIHYDDHTLYFSSNGHVGMGGMDLFRSRKNADGTWEKAENLGYPINTDGDETNLIVNAEGSTAYYSSDRKEGYGKQDLYSFALPPALRPTITICMKGTVYDEKNGNKLSAEVKVIDLHTHQVIATTNSDAQTGSYIISLPALVDYAVHVTSPGYLFYSENYNLEHGIERDWKWEPTKIDIPMCRIESGERIALRNVFFETDRYELLEASQLELNKVVEVLRNNPNLKIELGGHTDNEGNPANNMKLSERRAKAVYDYLVAQGIDPARLRYKGYGETQPVADNATEEGRAQNRRTEMKVL